MAKDYLPDSYLRKRQRDARLRRVRDVVAGFIIVAAAITVGGFVYYRIILPKRQAAGVTAEMAQQRQELSEQQDSAGMNKTAVPSGSVNSVNPAELGNTDLSSLNYTSSFPLINVSVETGSSGDERQRTEPMDSPVREESHPEDNAGSTTTPTQPKQDTAASKPPVEQKPANTESKPSEKPQEKKQEDKPATPAAPANGDSSSGVVYKVYAGSHHTHEAAEQQVKDLAAVGLNGTIIESKPNYLVFVGSFSGFEEASALRDRLKSSGFSAFASKTKK